MYITCYWYVLACFRNIPCINVTRMRTSGISLRAKAARGRPDKPRSTRQAEVDKAGRGRQGRPRSTRQLEALKDSDERCSTRELSDMELAVRLCCPRQTVYITDSHSVWAFMVWCELGSDQNARKFHAILN